MQLTERERNRVLCSDAAPGCSSGQESGSRCTGDQTARTSTSANFLSHFYQNWKIEMLRWGNRFFSTVCVLPLCLLFIHFFCVRFSFFSYINLCGPFTTYVNLLVREKCGRHTKWDSEPFPTFVKRNTHASISKSRIPLFTQRRRAL